MDTSQEPGALSGASSDLWRGKGVVRPSHLHLCGWYSLWEPRTWSLEAPAPPIKLESGSHVSRVLAARSGLSS